MGEEFYNRLDETYFISSTEYPNDRIERSCLTRFDIRVFLLTIKSDIRPRLACLYYFSRREWSFDRDGKFSANPALYDRLNREFSASFVEYSNTHIIGAVDRFTFGSDDLFSLLLSVF